MGISGRKWRSIEKGRKMSKSEPINYGNIPIKKLPPGEALGARDLQQWSHNRTLGRSGTGTDQTRAVTLVCSKCDGVTPAIEKNWTRQNGRKFVCRHCGNKTARVIRSKRIK